MRSLSRMTGPRRFGLSIQSKFLMMFLATSMLSVLVVGSIGYFNGRDSLQAEAQGRLATIREMRSYEVQSLFASIRRGTMLDSRNLSARAAARELIDGWNELGSTPLTPQQDASLIGFYRDTITPLAQARTGHQYQGDELAPSDPRARYLQFWYSRVNDTYDEKSFHRALGVDDPGDGSRYTRAHSKYHDYFRRLATSFNYRDMMVADLDGNVVYTASKGIDLGVNLNRGSYKNTLLAGAYNQVLRSGSVDSVVVTDFEDWAPSLGEPSLWVVSPIGDAAGVAGVLIGQVETAAINAAVTGDHQWEKQGFGATGEVYLAGGDGLMRSMSRPLFEDPARYTADVMAAGTPPELAERIAASGRSVNRQPVDSAAVDHATRGETGDTRGRDYLSDDALSSYQPLRVEGLDWVVVARMSTDEAFAPTQAFTRALVLPTLVLMIAVCLLSMLLAQVFSRPLHRLSEAVQQVSDGESGVQVPSRSPDEIGRLGRAFNALATTLQRSRERLDAERERSASLLRTLMPAPLVERYQRGEETIAESCDNVAVAVVTVVGLDRAAAGLAATEETEMLNTLTRGFDEAAQRAGIEVVRNRRGVLLAASGLASPRLDGAQRAVAFARSAEEVVQRYHRQHGVDLAARVGVAVGEVTSGLVGRADLAHDLWGPPVTVAERLAADTGRRPAVYISDVVRQRIGAGDGLAQAEPITDVDGAIAVWCVER